MCVDIPQLIECDGVALLPGWKTSKGATIEHCIATALGKRVMECVDISEFQVMRVVGVAAD